MSAESKLSTVGAGIDTITGKIGDGFKSISVRSRVSRIADLQVKLKAAEKLGDEGRELALSYKAQLKSLLSKDTKKKKSD